MGKGGVGKCGVGYKPLARLGGYPTHTPLLAAPWLRLRLASTHHSSLSCSLITFTTSFAPWARSRIHSTFTHHSLRFAQFAMFTRLTPHSHFNTRRQGAKAVSD